MWRRPVKKWVKGSWESHSLCVCVGRNEGMVHLEERGGKLPGATFLSRPAGHILRTSGGFTWDKSGDCLCIVTGRKVECVAGREEMAGVALGGHF